MHRSILAFLLLGSAAHAQCQGEDLRLTLTAAERADLDARIADMPYAQGNRWRAEKDGEVIHLVGTMHLSDPRLDAPAERLRTVMQGAGALLLEMPAQEQTKLTAALGQDPALILLDGTTLPELMDEDDWQSLSAAAKAHGLPAVMVARMRPWYLSMLLALPACAKAQMTQQDGLDVRLEAQAGEYGVPSVALEPFDTTFAIFNAEPLDDQLEMIGMTLAQQEDGASGFATTIAAYFDETAAEMWQLSAILAARSPLYTAQQASKAIEQTSAALLDQRNHDWIPVILAEAEKRAAPIVAAFGAAHLPGKNGVLQLLADDGWTLTREAF
ncbi:TraB/GumN family protein [Citreicella sp. C3M06]|uniref:TraB/GumN family protein n=1 Tax=Citreicella sp. C3M06 TaxID=2841564 RepID=UPI001C0A0AC7|nr:TraB/GumN family protein [Citreicella sp. C3M06]MBU2959540.1 TraB/GumN family protein [Citreicella sp. C3M06]